MNAPRPLVAALLFTFTLVGCAKEEISAYRIPKEHDPAPRVAATAGMPPMAAAAAAGASAGADMAATPVATATGGDLTWTAPAHWTTRPASAMRKATFIIPGDGGEAELSITAFPGDVGGELANLNRWRSQAPLNLPPIAAGDLEKSVQRVEHNGLKFALVDVSGQGSAPGRLLGAWVPYAGSTWFFKLTGPAALLEKENTAFRAFVASVKPAAASRAP